KPPNIVLSAVSHLKAQHELEGHKICETLSSLASKHPVNATKFQYPGSKKDSLFKSTIIHTEGKKSCKSCRGLQDSNLVKRKDRPNNSPQLHYGTIGSADQVMKDAILRDRWARKENILCFEMEAAGLMDSFPCLVIRGICDYADSHKNKTWQPYSAATAASYARELLLLISGQGVVGMNPIKQIEQSVVEIHQVVKDTSDTVRGLKNDSRRDKVFAKLPYAKGSSFDASDAEHDARCHPKTRIDLLHRIQEWAEDPSQKCIFWLNGMAGTGKSTISRTIAENFNKNHLLGASFFKRGEGDRGTAKKFFTTICTQLILQVPALTDHVEKAINTDPYLSGKSMREQFDKLILQPLLCLNQIELTTIIFVIDALDECEEKDDIKAILKLLPQVQESKSLCVRIFLTSRPELVIRLGFQQNNSYQDLVLHELPKPIIEQDIRLYLKDEFYKICDERSLSSSWPGNEAIEQLVQMAVPLFIFAATVCRFIKEGTHPKKRLQKFFECQATTSTSQMGRIYLPVLRQLRINEDDSKEVLQEFQNIVGVIILLATPLSAKSLELLLNIQGEDIRQLLDPLHSVLNVPSNMDTPVRILHLSFRDYLLITESPFRINEQETHEKIASRCLHVMENKLMHNICGMASYGTQRLDVDSQIIKQHLSAELEYSCHYWAYHLQQSKGRISETKILSFLKQHFLHWLEALSLLGIISEAVGIIDTLKSGIWRSISAKLSDFIYDAKRFTLKNIYIAGIAPLQLYCSGLVFSPMQKDLWSPGLQTLEGHSDRVNSVAFSPDGQKIASGSKDKTIKLWDTKTGMELQTLKGHSSPVESVAFSPDGQTIVSGSDDKTIKLWDAKTGMELQMFKGNSYPVTLSNTWVALGGEDLIWLPFEYRDFTCYAVKDATLVLGHRNGCVSIVAFHTVG
ncbi:G-protein beta WD-40 repeats containing protein, partial [Aspergillus arachidicola]